MSTPPVGKTTMRMRLRLYFTREPVILVLLSLMAIVSFVAVTGLSRLYQRQQESLGNRWFARGVVDLNAGRFDRAVTEFRAALVYSRDNYQYQLNLAEALLGEKRTDEARAYLVNLWEREPENGIVNLELARIAAQRGETEQALRYYHNAIYAAWPDNEEVKRRDARLELIEYLLKINAKTQVQSELIALEANLGDDPKLQVLAGDLFVRVQDDEHALAAYREALKSDRHNTAALVGAGQVTFELGRYVQAYRYLQAAVWTGNSDAETRSRLQTTDLVLQMDPFQRQISAAQRNRIVVKAFAIAGARLKTCAATKSSGSPPAPADLMKSWARMKPRITLANLQHDPDLAEAAMSLVFNIERQSAATCGQPAGADLALLLIAKLHEGS
jgi:Tfp pilus assembly protein PilF